MLKKLGQNKLDKAKKLDLVVVRGGVVSDSEQFGRGNFICKNSPCEQTTIIKD